MRDKNLDSIPWNSLSKLTIFSLLLLQLIRWSILPQFIDIYYHLATAWGFIQAGGYSGWDFWQYAPVGRPHIYPPLFHLILAGFIKAGINPVILAKLCEVFAPPALLLILWKFIRDNYSPKLAFFTALVFLSSFSFYLSLLNHIPATISLILGILSLGQLFKKNVLRSSILLALTFYTHIGISWFFALTFISYGLLNKEIRKTALTIFMAAFIFALPIVIKELNTLRFITSLGLGMHEKYLCQVKIIETILALVGLFQAMKTGKEYKLFAAMFLSSLIFVTYPYRFLSAEGYFPVILLAAFCIFNFYHKLNRRHLILVIAFFFLAFSPTFSMHKVTNERKINYEVKFFDSGFLNTLLAKGQILWFPEEYIPAAKLVKDNSSFKDITYCTFDPLGLTISSIAGRASANALLPEIKASQNLNPFVVSKIIIFTRLDNEKMVDSAVKRLNLSKIGENKFFIIYNNPNCQFEEYVVKASVSFPVIVCIGLVILLIFWKV